MSDSNYINTFNWDQHVIKDSNMGYKLVLAMNSEQKRLVQTYNQNQKKTQSFPTELSLPFINKSNQWMVQTRWNDDKEIHNHDTYTIAAQLETIYMAFVREAINRPYTMMNKYDPSNFYNEVLLPIKQLTVNTYIKYQNEFGQVTAKNPQIFKYVYEWQSHNIEAYRIQVINQEQTISNKRITFTTNYIGITGNPADISVYNNEQDIIWAILEYGYQTISQQLQQLTDIWNRNSMELDMQIVKAIDYYLQNRYVNKLVGGLTRKCVVSVKSTEFEYHLLSKAASMDLNWTLASKHNNWISLSLAELQQLFEANAGERIHQITDGKNKVLIWKYFGRTFHLRYSFPCGKLFIKFKVLGIDPSGDVITTA